MKKMLLIAAFVMAGTLAFAQSGRKSNVFSNTRIGDSTTTVYTNGTVRTTSKMGDTTTVNYSNGTTGTIRTSGNTTTYDFDSKKGRTTTTTTGGKRSSAFDW